MHAKDGLPFAFFVTEIDKVLVFLKVKVCFPLLSGQDSL